jgi:predicted ATPase/class 3 adenylate cyclase
MDLADHTALTRGMDPEDQMALVDPLITQLAEKVNEFGGHVARYQGDGFKSVFGLPIARENDPEQAIRAGLAIQNEAQVIAAELESEHGITDFKVRVGITTGLIFAGGETEGEDTIKGPPVNLAARLESAAQPGTVLISYETYKFVRGIFVLQQLEPIQVKGFTEPVEVFKVLGAKPRAFYRGMRLVEGIETRMIGRDGELATLQDAYYTVVEDGEPQIVTIISEAGLGKSRLLYEFENWVDLQPADVRLYRGRAHLESQRLPYNLLRSIFAFRFNIQDDDSLKVVQEKWLAGFLEVFEVAPGEGTNLEMQAHILGQLLGYDLAESSHVKPLLGEPQQLRDRSMVYLAGYFRAVARIMPVVVLLEDLHWADDSSLEALSRLGLELQDTPVLFVSAARPGLYERRPYWFEGRKFHSRLDLKPLSRRINRQLVSEVLQMVPDIPQSLSDLILTNSEGNPFYVEELVKVLVEAGVILKGDPHWRVDEPRLKDLDIPTTLTGVLQARLERLPKDERTLIQQASVVGRVFWDQAVWYLNHQGEGTLEEATIQDGLADLRNRELIYRRELSTFQEAREYIFKHAVLREVTYEGVLKKLRRIYHALAAEWLMEQRGDRTGEVVGLIADQLELAGEKEEALRYLKRAGVEAAAKYANDEAVDYFSRALALIPEEDEDTRFELLMAREEVLNLQAKRDLQRQDLEALEALAKKIGSIEKQMQVSLRWSLFHFRQYNYQSAAEEAEQVAVEAKARGNLHLAATGELNWGKALIWQFQEEVARQHLVLALDGFRITGDIRQEGETLRMLGSAAASLQDLQAWQEYAQQALSIARQIGDRSQEAFAITHLGVIASFFGEYLTAQKYHAKFLAIASEIGSRFQKSMALINLGGVAISLKEYPAARDYYEQSMAIAEATDDQIGEGDALLGLGDANAGLEMWDAASHSYKQAMEVYRRHNIEWGITNCRMGMARLALVQGDVQRALDHVDAILETHESDKRFGIYLPSTKCYLVCVQVLSAAGDLRVREVLEKGYTELQKRAANITDEDLRHSFLENVPWRRELVDLREEQQAKQGRVHDSTLHRRAYAGKSTMPSLKLRSPH